jgi:hypothetical protein
MPDLTPLRVGVTGSRFFSSVPVIRCALLQARSLASPGQPGILIHGQCDPRHPDTGRMIPWATARKMSWEVQGRYRGADWLCEWAALDGDLGWEIERHPAGWEAPCRPECKPGHRRRKGRGPEYCPAAGNYRNQEGIIGPGLDALLAFYQEGEANSGTADCVRRARRARITVFPYNQEGPLGFWPDRGAAETAL